MSTSPESSTELVDVNRALVHDLDLSHRLITELRRKREQLFATVEVANARAERAERRLALLAERIRDLSSLVEVVDSTVPPESFPAPGESQARELDPAVRAQRAAASGVP